MENNAFLTAQRANGSYVLNHSDFIIDKHHANKNCVWPNRSFQPFYVQQAISLHVQVSRLKTLTLQFAESVQHRFVLGFNRDDVLALGFVKLGSTLNGQIV